MTVEGARGETAMQMGKVLCYPDLARRTGGDAELIPWRTSMIHSEFQQINQHMQGNNNDPATKNALKQIDEMEKKLADANKRAKELIQSSNLVLYNSAAEESQRLAQQINSLSKYIDRFELNVANALWGEKTYSIELPFRDTIAQYYDTDAIQEANFIGDFERERGRINHWVEDKTKDRIKNLIPKGALDTDTRLVTCFAAHTHTHMYLLYFL